MSLLLEALKKAEKAKEEAQRRARESGAEPPSVAGAAPAQPEPKPLLTRDKLPSIATAPVDIGTEDLARTPVAPPPRATPVTLELEPEAPAPRPAPKPAARPAAAKSGTDEAAGRASAKKVFEAKFREPNPRMPFYITMGVLSVFTVGTIVYFWYQLRPPTSLVNSNPPREAQTAQVATAQPPAPPVASATPPGTESGISGLPGTAPRAVATAPALAAPQKPPVAGPTEAIVELPRLAPRTPAARPAAAAALPRTVITRSTAQVHPRVDSGYAAYTAGDLGTARSEYQQALREEPTNRDALLGLAALEVRASRYEAAEGLYMRLLQTDPRDAQAQAALIALRSGRTDPLVTESRVKSLLAADPGAHALNFTLGNQLAQQRRWAEAQQEYFKAYTAEPDNADFAYNLAVSLDHLRQNRQALEYYQRAIGLGEKRGASFDLNAARQRATQLAPMSTQ